MKKIGYFLFCILCSLVIMVSCIVSGSSRSYINHFIEGTWLVNNNVFERITFVNDGNWSYYNFVGDTIYGHFTVVPTPDDEPHWVWEKGQETIHAIEWKASDGTQGRMDWIDYVNDGCHMKVHGIYNHIDEDVLLTKVKTE